MRSVKIALVAAMALLGIAIGLTLLRSPANVAGTNKTSFQEPETIASTRHSTSYCQAGETLPRGTLAIRISLAASIGPSVSVSVSSGGHPITGGEQESAWTGWVVTVPVKPLAHAVYGATVCVSFHPHHETVALAGRRSPATVAAREGQRPLPGRMSIEYLRQGKRSWALLAPSIVRHMGYGRALAGTAIVFVALALLVTLAALATRLVVTDLR